MQKKYLVTEILHGDIHDIEKFLGRPADSEDTEKDIRERIGEMTEEELRKYEAYYYKRGYNRLQDLLDQAVNHVAVARNTSEQIWELILMGFDRHDLKAHGYTDEDIREYYDSREMIETEEEEAEEGTE